MDFKKGYIIYRNLNQGVFMKNMLFIIIAAIAFVGCSKNPIAPIQTASSTIYSYAYNQYRVDFKDWPMVSDGIDTISSDNHLSIYLYHIDIDISSLLDSSSIVILPLIEIKPPARNSLLVSDSISSIRSTVDTIYSPPYNADINCPPVFKNGHIYVQCHTDTYLLDGSGNKIDSSVIDSIIVSSKNKLRFDLNSSWMTFRIK